MKTRTITNINPEAFATPYELALKAIKEKLTEINDQDITLDDIAVDSLIGQTNNHSYFEDYKSSQQFIINNIDSAQETFEYLKDELGNPVNPINDPEFFALCMIQHKIDEIVTDLTVTYNEFDLYLDSTSVDIISEYLELDDLHDYSKEQEKDIEIFDQDWNDKIKETTQEIMRRLDNVENGAYLEAVFFHTDDCFVNDSSFAHDTQEQMLQFMFDNDYEFSYALNEAIEEDRDIFHYSTMSHLEAAVIVEYAKILIEETLSDYNIEASKFCNNSFIVNDELRNVLKAEFAPSLEDKLVSAEEKSNSQNKDINTMVNNKDDISL